MNINADFAEQIEKQRTQLESLGLANSIDGYLLEAKLYDAIKNGNSDVVFECLNKYANHEKPTRLLSFLPLPPAYSMQFGEYFKKDNEKQPYWHNMIQLLKTNYWPPVDEDSNSYLHHAVMADNPYAVAHLLADKTYKNYINICNKDDLTPMAIARKHNNLEIFELLANAGATFEMRDTIYNLLMK